MNCFGWQEKHFCHFSVGFESILKFVAPEQESRNAENVHLLKLCCFFFMCRFWADPRFFFCNCISSIGDTTRSSCNGVGFTSGWPLSCHQEGTIAANGRHLSPSSQPVQGKGQGACSFIFPPQGRTSLHNGAPHTRPWSRSCPLMRVTSGLLKHQISWSGSAYSLFPPAVDVFMSALSIFCSREVRDPSLNAGQRWRLLHLLMPRGRARVRVSCSVCALIETRRREELRLVKDKMREPRGRDVKGRREERLPGWRSGLWPLMSIWLFGAYCGVRGLDFYGDGFHLLESSPSTSLHLYCTSFSSPFAPSADWTSDPLCTPLLPSLAVFACATFLQSAQNQSD